MIAGALFLSLVLGALLAAVPCLCLSVPSHRRSPLGAPTAFSVAPAAQLPCVSLSSTLSRGPHSRGPDLERKSMGRYYAIRWGPKSRTIVRSLEALQALIQDLEGGSSSSNNNSSSGSNGSNSSTDNTNSSEGPISACWQVAARPSLEEAEAWLDEQDVVVHERPVVSSLPESKRRAVAAEDAARPAMPLGEPAALNGGEDSLGTKALTQEIVTAYADGACLANGRPEAAAGFGVYFGQGDPRNVSLPLFDGPQTNQRAELTAILAALISFAYADDTAAKQRHHQIESEQVLHLYCDSNYAMQCVGAWGDRWEVNGWVTSKREAVVNSDLVKAVRMVLRERPQKAPHGARWRGKVKFIHVRGHSGDLGNQQADTLAVSGANQRGYKPMKDSYIAKAIADACKRAN